MTIGWHIPSQRGQLVGSRVFDREFFIVCDREALRHGSYTCVLGPHTRLPMMYMPDAIRATLELMQADPTRLQHRNAFNIAAFNVTPAELAQEIQKHLPHFTIGYQLDPMRQAIADSWPHTLDDSAARQEWGWKPQYDLAGMTKDMLKHLSVKISPST